MSRPFIAGVGTGLGGGLWLETALEKGDPGAAEHNLSEIDTRKAIDVYNDALGQRLARDFR